MKRTMATMARTTLARITRMTITGRDISGVLYNGQSQRL
jgi:hypothetical protein